MNNLERGLELHDRATRGLRLSDAGRTELAAWYAAQDAEERAILEANARPFISIKILRQIESYLRNWERDSKVRRLHNSRVNAMQTIEVNIEEPLLVQIDQAARTLEMTRADFIEAALQRALQRQRTIARERQHAERYTRDPQTVEEIEEWESEQEWGE